jgi:hypothetical protein
MGKTIIMISIFFVIGYVCNAQSDTIRKTSDSLVIQQNISIQKDSISSTLQKDSISSALQSDSSNYALLFVYRPRNYTGSLIGYDLDMTNSIMKEQYIGRVKNNSKFVVKIFQEGMTQIVAVQRLKDRIIVVEVSVPDLASFLFSPRQA